MKPLLRRCAVYTRKSTEEGLDQNFNSIDAQREACLAYITSQKSEGWTAIKESYDDGGFSGGTVERPALQKLLHDIRTKKIDIIVVYKIDRLTRSLMDFTKLLDLFDEYEVTFISITQSFNTTTSLGRLTMNILLSFAQFEREITAERIRDKFSASKKKGIWMGGTTPTGYTVKDRRLLPNTEADFIRKLYELYLELGTIANVLRHFKSQGIKSPMRTRVNGVQAGGTGFSTGSIRHILMNPVYIGKIRHKTDLYDGLHAPIIPMELWQKVQDNLALRSLKGRREKKRTAHPFLLDGKLFDMDGTAYVPTYTTQGNRKYKYYISQRLADKYPDHPKKSTYRLSAVEIERHVYKTLQAHLREPALLGKIIGVDFPQEHSNLLRHIANNGEKLTHVDCAISRIIVDTYQYTIEIQVSKLCHYIDEALKTKTAIIPQNYVFKIIVPFRPASTTRATNIIEPRGSEGDIEIFFDMRRKDIKKLVRGAAWQEEHFKGKTLGSIAAREGVSRWLVDKLIKESFKRL